jgi:glycosyltransferase involved in cell wall biosynthesis
MKILYHHRTASQDGQAVHIDEMIAALRAQGHEVRVVAPGAPADRSMGGEVAWVRWLKSLLPRAAYELLECGYSLLAYRRLAAAAREFSPDFIYERYNLFLFAGVMLKRRFGLPLLLEVNSPLAQERASHGGLSLARLARRSEGWIWRNADCVLPVTAVLARDVQAQGVAAERITVIHNGINAAHFAAAPGPVAAKAALGLQDRLVLGFTGFVRDWHGVDRVVAWMATVQAPRNAQLLIVGDGPARADLEARARQLGLGDRVAFTGVVARERVPALVAAFDIALQPAVVPYASPLKLLEYLALGKAIVAPREPNLMELLTDADNAVLFDAGAAGALEQALSRLCADAPLRQHLSRGAKATIDRLNLTWDGNARRVVALAASAGARPERAHAGVGVGEVR